MAERFRTIEEVRAEAVVCPRCRLCQGRTNVVFGEGPVPARMLYDLRTAWASQVA